MLCVLFLVTLKRRDLSRALVITWYPCKLSDVLSVEKAARLLEAAPGKPMQNGYIESFNGGCATNC